MQKVAEGVVALRCNPLTLQPEQSGGPGSNLSSTFERHDKGSRARLELSYFCIPALCAENRKFTSPSLHFMLTLIRSENQTQQITEDRLTKFWFLQMGDVFDATKLSNQVQKLNVNLKQKFVG